MRGQALAHLPRQSLHVRGAGVGNAGGGQQGQLPEEAALVVDHHPQPVQPNTGGGGRQAGGREVEE